ncbi:MULTISPECIES: glutathione S-transferase N-terminal domain-containing protein [Thermomonas]|jgi:glutathione S-transferase|uniref:Glutathione S-transferase N-terminal domain-containing protein n=1 Tax=Thermomonas beijingensis TaxID=2872701 RepID=A0ABS7TBJ8_9GAMM|nr:MULTISPECIES: glutathione S-transferase N-terminal domain-containing protein [Thermomonas]MBS0460789.1 glutathione S-transferase N-terminal domain-containing protein [Pseudomonadota bacterium]MDE2382526.1 glutathione S-transferase N-terminal domain-containing protein [Xanthomonadaceae bacterium]MBZ4185214.1 glutathione S-transferase N-terminal domain-containing protein [Thermomonas beijingensis]HOC10737.1 glutathione S-transferase N-terminal domain-containing protein [Thermomonas sp.]HQA015
MKLYTSPGACSTADHIVLQWLGQPYEFQIVTREQRATPEYRAINPSGAVPALQVGDWVLTQNSAILHYLTDRFPEAGLCGDGGAQSRAEVNRWLAFVNADVHPAFKPLFGATHYLEDQAAIDKSHANARAQLRGLFANADAQLEGKDWITGSRSIADPYLFITLQWAKKTGVDLSGLDNLARFDAHMANDAGVQAAMKAEGLI